MCRSPHGRHDPSFLRTMCSSDNQGNESQQGPHCRRYGAEGSANLERGPPAAVFALEIGFRDFESSTWRLTGSTSSPWADKKSNLSMGLWTAASKKVMKNVRSPNVRRRRMCPQQGMSFPSAPESDGQVGFAFDR